jgi:NTE family protein
VSTALVLGGGGVAGIAWETGLLAGLADEGIDLTGADRLVGTSAGAAVAAQITSGLTLDALVERQVGPSHEIEADLDVGRLTAMFGAALRGATTALEMRASIGGAALDASAVTEAARITVIEHRLPVHEWPAGRDVQIVAADAESGEMRVFDGRDGVGLVAAVAASCAVPGVWPPVTIGDRRYIDGGVRSSTNADLAAGADVILVVAPVIDIPGIADPVVVEDFDALAAAKLWLTPDDASTAAIGTNPLDPATREPAVRAGRAQGRAAAADVRAIWQ